MRDSHLLSLSNSAGGEHEEAQVLAHYWENHANTAASEAQIDQNKR